MCFALIVFELKYLPLAGHTVTFKGISEKIKYSPKVISFMQTPAPTITFKGIIGRKWLFFLQNLPLSWEGLILKHVHFGTQELITPTVTLKWFQE